MPRSFEIDNDDQFDDDGEGFPHAKAYENASNTAPLTSLAPVLMQHGRLAVLLLAGLILLGGLSLNPNLASNMFQQLGGGHQQRPLHIYIMAGQSNMVGWASSWHLRELLNQANTTERYAHLYDAQLDQWTVRDNVFVVLNGSPKGRLTMGQGHNATLFGPELGFGWVMSKAYEEEADILLLKTAYNGMSLHVCFRPPSVDLGNYTNFRRHPVPEYRYGECYRNMMNTINSTIHNLTHMIPDLYYQEVEDEEENEEKSRRKNLPQPRYEFKGFVWYQGWGDRGPQPLAEYSNLLAHMLRDIRTELRVPKLPVVIGGSGQHARKYKDKLRMQRLTEAQQSITTLPDFKTSSAYVATAPFFNVNDTRTYGVQYHYMGHADTIYDAGEAFGQAMLKLLHHKA